MLTVSHEHELGSGLGEQSSSGFRGVFLGLGSNQGDIQSLLGAALERVRQVVTVNAVSSIYHSDPVGYLNQGRFLNLVCAGYTSRPPSKLLSAIHAIEHALDRVRTFRNAPRTIDIDILAYGDLVLDTPELTLPHPRMMQRAFVLVPLVEIAPEWRHPVLNKTARELLAEAGPLERIERWGPPPAL